MILDGNLDIEGESQVSAAKWTVWLCFRWYRLSHTLCIRRFLFVLWNPGRGRHPPTVQREPLQDVPGKKLGLFLSTAPAQCR